MTPDPTVLAVGSDDLELDEPAGNVVEELHITGLVRPVGRAPRLIERRGCESGLEGRAHVLGRPFMRLKVRGHDHREVPIGDDVVHPAAQLRLHTLRPVDECVGYGSDDPPTFESLKRGRWRYESVWTRAEEEREEYVELRCRAS